MYWYGRSQGNDFFRVRFSIGERMVQERTVQGTKVPGNECSRERIVLRMKVPGNEWSRERKFHHGNECSRERIVLRMKVPGNEWSRERKFHHGNECSRERIVLTTNISAFIQESINQSNQSTIYYSNVVKNKCCTIQCEPDSNKH